MTAGSPLVTACRRAGVTDSRILAAVAAVDRRRFLPPDVLERADVDAPIRIGAGQTTSQPSLIAVMLSHLQLPDPDAQPVAVLEIGTGSGYQTALLAHLATRVVGVERHAELAEAARRRLADLPGVEVHVGDGTLGWPDAAPYDGITVGATGPRVPAALVDQLADGGRLVMPVAAQGAERLEVLVRRGPDVERAQVTLPVRFVPLVGEQGYGDDDP